VESLVVLVTRIGAAGTYELRENKIKPANRKIEYQKINLVMVDDQSYSKTYIIDGNSKKRKRLNKSNYSTTDKKRLENSRPPKMKKS